MGTGKKESTRKEREGKTNNGMGNVKVKGENFYRSAKKVRNLNIVRKGGEIQRNRSGKITKAAPYQSRDAPVARVEPNRKWFTNTRVISQQSLEAFRGAIAAQQSDPYSFLMKQNKLPMSLIRDDETRNGLKQHEAKMKVEGQPFGDTFGPKSRRKRVKLDVGNMEDLAGRAGESHETYLDRQEEMKLLSGNLGAGGEEQTREENVDEEDGVLGTAREPIFSKGQSKRIWNELYKVIDSSDVVLHILDARDPLGTRCRSVEKYIQEEAPHKHLVFVLNKCDLVPTSVAAQWVRTLSKERPTLAFHASITNSFGKGSLISLLRQFSSLHSNRKQVSVGFIGYPNTGKSSIINTLRKKKVCNVAPIPGETKVWQYITLMKRIYLIDCPGVVPPSKGDKDEDLLLRGVVRVERLENPAQYLAAVLQKVQRRHLERTYDVRDWNDATDFLDALARKSGKLRKQGEADVDAVAKVVLNDFLRGKIPWFEPPPGWEENRKEKVESKDGRLGEMRGKRKMIEQDEDEEMEDASSNGGVGIDSDVETAEDFAGLSEDASSSGLDSDGEGDPGQDPDQDSTDADAG
ncbi:MAG: GTPase required for pre-60S ribosomal subunit nuclear export and maturation [Bogoriella megaspora]|nr:MAG: GTPase required for pre-60S ribosomal subunit nuclear export and maturation [Bogoriella megaspora]